jgi:hypothetical protein
VAVVACASVLLGWPLEHRAYRSQTAHLQACQDELRGLHEIRSEIKQLEDKLAPLRLQDAAGLRQTRQTPMTSLIGVISRSASRYEGRLWLTQLEYRAPPWTTQADSTAASSSQLTMDGFAMTNPTAAHFVASLRDQRLLKQIELRPRQASEISESTACAFRIQCEF